MQNVQAEQAVSLAPETSEQLLHTSLESTLSQLRRLYYDTALSANSTVLSAIQRLIPTSHILFGTDYPPDHDIGVRPAVNGLATYSGWSVQERTQIASKNALRLFPRLQDEQT
ncbi:amidohydrolase family protein [Ktedonobacter sp. SOSP1-52]|uniref:amidohydrolase family protein n=1 Tax=Ktedonobacter sp. SOSP1-52 TaxID=2778366 RepID=UPI0035B31DE1